MKTTFEDYCRQLQERADAVAEADEVERRLDHMHAFNFGRTVERINRSQTRWERWVRVGWLLAGLMIGVAGARVSPNNLGPVISHHLSKATQIVRVATNHSR